MADDQEEKKDESNADPFGNWDDVVGKYEMRRSAV